MAILFLLDSHGEETPIQGLCEKLGSSSVNVADRGQEDTKGCPGPKRPEGERPKRSGRLEPKQRRDVKIPDEETWFHVRYSLLMEGDQKEKIFLVDRHFDQVDHLGFYILVLRMFDSETIQRYRFKERLELLLVRLYWKKRDYPEEGPGGDPLICYIDGQHLLSWLPPNRWYQLYEFSDSFLGQSHLCQLFEILAWVGVKPRLSMEFLHSRRSVPSTDFLLHARNGYLLDIPTLTSMLLWLALNSRNDHHTRLFERLWPRCTRDNPGLVREIWGKARKAQRRGRGLLLYLMMSEPEVYGKQLFYS